MPSPALDSAPAAPLTATGDRLAWPDLMKPAPKQGGGKKDAAVVVAIGDYFKLSDIAGAVENAEAWRRFLVQTRGVASDRVLVLKNSDGTNTEIESVVDKAVQLVGRGGTLWFVFIGHGAPSADGKDGLLVGVDAQQKESSFASRSVLRSKLLEKLRSARGARVVAVLDTCFSGLDSSGNSLVPGTQFTVNPKTLRQGFAATRKVTVLSAGAADQIAGPLPGASRPAFSYLVLGALRGWGDANGDGRVSASEAVSYAQKALREHNPSGRQVPQLAGKDVKLTRRMRRGQLEPAPKPRALLSDGRSVCPKGTRPSGDQCVKTAVVCPPGTSLKGEECVRKVGRVVCPSGSTLEGEVCVARVDKKCEAGMQYKRGRGCVPKSTTTCSRGFHFKRGRGCLPNTAPVSVVAPPTPVPTPPPARPEPAGKPAGMVLVPAGSFWMGCAPHDTTCSKDEKPRHRVTLDAFYIDKTETTVSAYRKCVSAGSCTAADTGKYCNWNKSGRDSHPINCVDWDQAAAYCSWAKKRLPTEAEWEKAARGTDGRLYPWGNSSPSGKACWDRWKSKLGTCRVGSFGSGASAYGALDMAGNVWEWTSDWYDKGYYAKLPGRNPTGPSGGSDRVSRGGSWYYGSANYLRASYRSGVGPGSRLSNLGFRCARPAR